MSFPTAARQPAHCWVGQPTQPFPPIILAPSESPLAEYPIRLHVAEGGVSAGPREAIFGPWRVQPAVADLTGSGLPDLLTMDLELDLVSQQHASACGRKPLSAAC